MSFPYPILADVVVAAPDVLAYLRNTGTVPLARAVHAAYTIAGYGISVALPDAASQPARLGTLMPRTELENHLETLAKQNVLSSPMPAAFPALPWQQIVLMLLEFVRAWLSGNG